jgi:dethiobiotin synthetase
MPVIFITGIDTDSGKTIATGLMARYLIKSGISVITQKIVQTGCDKISDDIAMHRKIMGIDLTEDDRNGLTCPYIFKYPASPHLSAGFENKKIDINIISEATKQLSAKYDIVLLEGVGGLLVPLNNETTLLDYIEMNNYSIIIISSAKLGSINHTLLTMEAIKNRDLKIRGLFYNHFPKQDREILNDTRDVIEKYLSQHWFNASIIDIPCYDINATPPDIDCSGFLCD